MSYLTSAIAPEVFESALGTPFWLWNGREYVKLAGEQLREEMKLWEELPEWHRKILCRHDRFKGPRTLRTRRDPRIFTPAKKVKAASTPSSTVGRPVVECSGGAESVREGGGSLSRTCSDAAGSQNVEMVGEPSSPDSVVLRPSVDRPDGTAAAPARSGSSSDAMAGIVELRDVEMADDASSPPPASVVCPSVELLGTVIVAGQAGYPCVIVTDTAELQDVEMALATPEAPSTPTPTRTSIATPTALGVGFPPRATVARRAVSAPATYSSPSPNLIGQDLLKRLRAQLDAPQARRKAFSGPEKGEKMLNRPRPMLPLRFEKKRPTKGATPVKLTTPVKRELQCSAEDKENVSPATANGVDVTVKAPAGVVPRKPKGILKKPRRAERPPPAVIKRAKPGQQLQVQVQVPVKKSVRWAPEVIAKVSVLLLRSPRNAHLTRNVNKLAQTDLEMIVQAAKSPAPAQRLERLQQLVNTYF
ncbi:hypothetical protein BD311DRAFT_867669 [Dichomitus squalens]|uniref:Uncharacterized protein n=1 Tax=Dichomitus squalens TaxID=114155 RepID=A0A4Q9MES0_9APHY|nr:hypothetical protein BD311DRAFT_867669 [Dichomitus squalens]